MPYIDTFIKEGNIQHEFYTNILQSCGWVKEKEFYKIAYDKSVISPTVAYVNSTFDVKVAKHVLFSSVDIPNTYLGIAISGDLTLKVNDLKTITAMPVNSIDEASNQAFINYVEGIVNDLESTLTNIKLTRFFNPNTLYFYMTEKLPDIIDSSWYVIPWEPFKLEQGCLDIEVFKAYYEQNTTSTYKFVIREPQLEVLQSPISKCMLRCPVDFDTIYSIEYDTPQNLTNWWGDSDISVKGFIDSKGFMFIVQADTVPAWEDNIVPSIPLYFGQVEPLNDEHGNIIPDNAVAFFAGSVPSGSASTVPTFDMDDPDKDKFYPTLTPILKSYPRHPSNGVDTVMVKRSKYGARYQAYYLAWNTTPNAMPPDRSDRHETETSSILNRDYPRAWNQPDSDEYKYWFNPSRYSHKIHSSKIYIVHPEEGIRGALRNVIGMSPIGITSGKIRVLKDPCGVDGAVYDYYRYFVCDGVSPLTKRPGTPYRPVGLGISENPV